MRYLLSCFIISISLSIYAGSTPTEPISKLRPASNFFRLTFDYPIHMPNDIPDMGLVGVNYFSNLTSDIYAGFGGYGSVTGTQGGLFTLGIEGGIHHEFIPRWWGDAGLFIGGGGGKSSLTGGGLMLRPHAGIAYDLPWGRLGLFYSYISFPNGQISSHQGGISFDVPFDVYYLCPDDHAIGHVWHDLKDILSTNKFVDFQHNDFALLLQAYRQQPGTLNIAGDVQDGTMGLVGAEFDHYLTPEWFWWLKTSGAFSGIPNGYMDVLGGLGYQLRIGNTPFAFIPQLGLGAGGGGKVETGGGFLLNPLLGVQWDVIPQLSARISSGYLWSPQGNFQAVPITAELIAHLDVATPVKLPKIHLHNTYVIQGWRLQVFNETYLHPQRASSSITSSIEMIGIQIDQLILPWFFLSYQGSGAYQGYQAGGYATGMIGPGLQTPSSLKHPWQAFAEVLIGAGGGGGLALSGGSLIEPLVGLRYAITPTIGLQGSIGELKALRNDLKTPVIHIGITSRFDMLNRKSTE